MLKVFDKAVFCPRFFLTFIVGEVPFILNNNAKDSILPPDGSNVYNLFILQ